MRRMSCTVSDRSLAAFENALGRLPDGYHEGLFDEQRWGSTIRRSEDGKRVWLYAEALAGGDIVSFNFYRLSAAGPTLKPCEMSSDKVIDFVLGFRPDAIEDVSADDNVIRK
jgi:hypothetical protein